MKMETRLQADTGRVNVTYDPSSFFFFHLFFFNLPLSLIYPTLNEKERSLKDF